MEEAVLRIIGLGITLSELLIEAEEKKISNRRVFMIVNKLMTEGEIFKVDNRRKDGQVFIMPSVIEYINKEDPEEYKQWY